MNTDVQNNIIDAAFPDCYSIDCETEDAWVRQRRNGVGASESSSIFGVGYAGASPVTVWAEKTGFPQEITPALQRLFDRGHLMEPVIAAEVEAETGFKVLDTGNFTIFRSDNPLFSLMFATLDRVIVHDELGAIPLELKNIQGRNWAEYEGDTPPLKHVVQCQHQMAVTGAGHVMLACLIGGSDLKLFVVKRDEGFVDVMAQKIIEFWGYVTSGEMPPVDESEATAKALARVFPQDDGETVELPIEFDGLAEELAELKQEAKETKAKITAIDSRIKAELGTATYGTLPGGGRFSWKTQERKGYTVEPSTSRVLRKLKK